MVIKAPRADDVGSAEFAAATLSAAAETAIAQGALALAGTVVDAAATPHIRERLLA